MNKETGSARVAALGILICAWASAMQPVNAVETREATLVGVVNATFNADDDLLSVQLRTEEAGKKITYQVVLDRNGTRMGLMFGGDIVRVIASIEDREDGKWLTAKKFFERVSTQGNVLVTKAEDGSITAISLSVPGTEWWGGEHYFVKLDEKGKALGSTLAGKLASVIGYIASGEKKSLLEIVHFEPVLQKEAPSDENPKDEEGVQEDDESAEEME